MIYNYNKKYGDKMKKITLKIDGMHCDGCATRLENALKMKEHISKANVSFKDKKAVIEYNEIDKKDIEKYIEEIGFHSLGE